jgi:hypothetical protein
MDIMEFDIVDENTPSNEIIFSAVKFIAKYLKNIGYKSHKGRDGWNITSEIKDFEFNIYVFAVRGNRKGYKVCIRIDCIIYNKRFNEGYLGGSLGGISMDSKKEWELYGGDKYENSLKDIIQRLDNYFIPLTDRFINDIDNLVFDVVNNGFYPNNKQTGCRINTNFLKRYGNKELLEKAMQKYYDNYISKDYETHEKFKMFLFKFKNGTEFDPWLAGDLYVLIKTIVEDNLNIKMKK